MSVEDATYIAQLNPDSPDGDVDKKFEGDDEIRNLKDCLQGQFPNLGLTAVSVSATEINLLDGFTYLGTAAALDAGTAVGNAVQLTSAGGTPTLPAVDGSLLTGVATTDTLVSDIDTEDTHDGMWMLYFMGQM